MSIVREHSEESNIVDELVDLREQPYNQRETGPIERVQLPAALITTLHGVVFDIDLNLFRNDTKLFALDSTPKRFYEKALAIWLSRDPALARAEVRDSGRGLHVILWFDEPVVFRTEADRQRWDGIVQVLQGALPVDPDQPGITGLTRPVGSINGKTGRPVELLEPGTPVPIAEVLGLHGRMARAPFRTVMTILLGADRVSPCPVCGVEGSSLSALDREGRCYGSCSKLELAHIYDLVLAPRGTITKGAG